MSDPLRDTNLSLVMTPAYASKFASLALAHVTREFPNKLDHVLLGVEDAATPKALHPIFYGSFDWHSCVHGYWLLARIYRQYPLLPEADAIRSLFNAQFVAEKVRVETEYAAHPARGGFERPYGWAWLLMLAAELATHESEEGRGWNATLAPLADVFAQRFLAFLPKATYPVRVGTHFNTAFAALLALEYAEVKQHGALSDALRSAVVRWYANDVDCQAWEPGGDDFLSSTLVEAACMQRAWPSKEFARWLNDFLPRVLQMKPATLFAPATVSDRSDGKIAHLDGLNLSRAWCWRLLAGAWDESDARREVALETANIHLRASLPHVAGDYMGEHWLATYALLALEASTTISSA